MIPSSCLNCTISGLISRTFLRSDIIGESDFHGAVFYEELMSEDCTYEFIDYIESRFNYEIEPDKKILTSNGMEDVKKLSEMFDIRNINYIKPGIGETTRVLLRRVPWKVVIDKRYKESRELDHIRQLALEKDVGVEYVHMNNYKCCGLIKQLADI